MYPQLSLLEGTTLDWGNVQMRPGRDDWTRDALSRKGRSPSLLWVGEACEGAWGRGDAERENLMEPLENVGSLMEGCCALHGLTLFLGLYR